MLTDLNCDLRKLGLESSLECVRSLVEHLASNKAFEVSGMDGVVWQVQKVVDVSQPSTKQRQNAKTSLFLLTVVSSLGS